MAVQLSLLGGFEINEASGASVKFPTLKSKALLAYLAVNGEQAHSREKLSDLLWGSHQDGHARASLRQALSRVRKSWPTDTPCCLVANGSTVTLDAGSITLDVAEFERLAAQGTPGTLEKAADLYRGDLLDGFSMREESFDEWLRDERARLRDLAQGVFATLLEHYLSIGAIERGIPVARQLLSLDPLQEGVHRTLIRFYLDQERRGAAVAQYQRCCQLLRDELGLQPDPETERLYQEIMHSAPVAEVSDGASQATAEPQGGTPAAPTPATTTVLADPPQLVPPSARPAVAVLPFANMSGAASEDYFCDGVTEDIITELARFRDLAVIARNSSFAYRDTAVTAQQIGRELGVQFLLEGSVRRFTDRIRVVAQLIEAESGHHVWAERYDEPIDDLLSVQDDLTRRIVVTLAGRIEEDRLAQARRKPTESWVAYDHWLQGMAFLRTADMKSSQRATASFEQALATDPNYARAYAGLAMAQFRMWSCFNWTAWWKLEEKAFDYACKAVALDDCDHYGHSILGTVRLYLQDFESAQRHLDRAVALNPNDASVLANLAGCWGLLGRAGDAVAAGEAAIRLNPYHPDWYLATLGIARFIARDFTPAVRTMERAPDALCDTRAWLAAACAHAGNTPAAERHAREFVRYCSEHFGSDPKTELAHYTAWLVDANSFLRPEDAALFVDGLRKSGLPA